MIPPSMTTKSIAYLHLVTAAAYGLVTKRSTAFSIVAQPLRISDYSSHRLVSDFQYGIPLNHDSRPRVPFSNDRRNNPRYYQSNPSKVVITKRFNSRGSGNDDEEKSLFAKALDKIKSVIPFLKNDKQKKAELARRQSASRVSSEIDRMFQDAPLGLRMVGKMISPLISSLAGGLMEAAREQTRQMDELLNQCENIIASDLIARQELGEMIDMGRPFSQSSSTVSVNGVTRKQIEARFQVRGNRGGGIATLYASERGIENLILNVNGRNININSSGPVSVQTEKTKASLGKNKRFGKDDIIDAELVEKVKK
jgi:hypothetical protein